MAWYEWLALGLIAFALLAIVAVRVFRVSRRGRRFMSLSMRAKLGFGRSLLVDPGVPALAKLALLVLVTYLALPLDLIPDFVPVVGQLDDGLVIVAAVGLLLLAVPRDRFELALERAEGRSAARARPAARA